MAFEQVNANGLHSNATVADGLPTRTKKTAPNKTSYEKP